jgi:hypothetical protein
MTMPCIQLHCDTCGDTAFLYRLYGTQDALCAACFIVANPPELTVLRRHGRTRTTGPAAAGCARRLRMPPRAKGVHRVVSPPRRWL